MWLRGRPEPAACSLLGLIYRRRRDMCRGYSQSSLVGAKTATLLLPPHLESRLSGSAERLSSLTPSFSPSSIHPSLSTSLLLSCCFFLSLSLSLPLLPPLFTICLAPEAQLKFKIALSLFPLSHSLSLQPCPFTPTMHCTTLPPPPLRSQTLTHLMKDKTLEKRIEIELASRSSCGRDQGRGTVTPFLKGWSRIFGEVLGGVGIFQEMEDQAVVAQTYCPWRTTSTVP